MDIVVPHLENATQWWESVELWSALVGAVVGAIVGGAISAVISFVLAKQASKEALSRDQEARSAADKATAISALIKTKNIINVLYGALKSMNDNIEQANAAGHGDLQLWQKVQPVVGIREPERFTTSEIALLTEIDSDVANALALLEAQSDSSLDALKVYFNRRLAVTEGMPATVEGAVMVTQVSQKELTRLEPRWAELQSLIKDVVTQMREDLTAAIPVAEQLGPTCKRTSRYRNSLGSPLKG